MQSFGRVLFSRLDSLTSTNNFEVRCDLAIKKKLRASVLDRNFKLKQYIQTIFVPVTGASNSRNRRRKDAKTHQILRAKCCLKVAGKICETGNQL